MRGWRRRATAERTVAFAPAAAEAPLLMAARLAGTDDRGRRTTEAHYNGRIDSPRLSGRALPLDEALALHQRPLPERLRPGLIGAWDFAQEIPTQRVIDISSNALHGETVNLPARAMTGYNWSGAEMNWSAAPHEYGAIHFHDDDIYDAGWDSDFALSVPETLRSGCYAVHVSTDEDEDYISFFVRRPAGKPTAKILYLAETATYLAYANHAFNFAVRLGRDAGQPPGHHRPLGTAPRTCIRSSATRSMTCTATAAASATPRGCGRCSTCARRR